MLSPYLVPLLATMSLISLLYCGPGRIEYEEYVKWKTEDAGKYGEKESAFTAAHAEMWTQIRYAPLAVAALPWGVLLLIPSLVFASLPRERAEMNKPGGSRPLNTTGL